MVDVTPITLPDFLASQLNTMDRKHFFNFFQDHLTTLHIDDLKSVSSALLENIEVKYPLTFLIQDSQNFQLDIPSLPMYNGPSHIIPVSVYGDGNCLP
jgi:hypothetical protein